MRRWAAEVAFLLSAAIHAGLFAAALSVPALAKRAEAVAVEIVETARPTPPPEPPPRLEPRKVAAASPPGAPPARQPPAPPPPNTPPPPSEPRQAPLHVGITMSSTTEAGATAVPVGNTAYGKPSEKAPDPAAVEPYSAERYAPPAELTTLPETVECKLPKEEYPQEARRIGFEGSVRLRLRIDEEGRVTRVTVIDDPGHGLGQAAARGVPQRCRFRPARRGDQVVATEIPFVVRFELP